MLNRLCQYGEIEKMNSEKKVSNKYPIIILNAQYLASITYIFWMNQIFPGKSCLSLCPLLFFNSMLGFEMILWPVIENNSGQTDEWMKTLEWHRPELKSMIKITFPDIHVEFYTNFDMNLSGCVWWGHLESRGNALSEKVETSFWKRHELT